MSIACILQVACGEYLLFKVHRPHWRAGLFFRIGGHAIGVGFRWAFRKIDLQHVFREMLKLLPGVIYISGSLGAINFPSGLPRSALQADAVCPHSSVTQSIGRVNNGVHDQVVTHEMGINAPP